ncbi:MAG: FAD/NAD(P)-binding oxidoreductase [Halobacteriales archaeon]
MERIVIIGGGTAGTVIANRLSDKLAPELSRDEVEVVVINDGPDHYYKPTYLYIPFGLREVHDAKEPLADLLDRKVNLVVDRVTGIDTDDERVSLQEGRPMDYDHLVVATGAELAPEETPGLKEGGHHFYGPQGATELRDALAEFEEGHLVLSVIGVPHMCPAAPVEFVLMADEWFREQGRREDIEITYTYPIMRAHGLEPVAEWAQERFDERDINVETLFNVEEIDPDEQTMYTMEQKEVDYDLLVGIPPHKGDPIVKESGLGEDGWVEVDRHTMEAENAEDVYAVGDAADIPTSKAGSVAHYESGPIADRIVSRVRGQVPTARFDGKTICFLEAGLEEAIFIEFDYERTPETRDENKYMHWAKLAYNESYWLTARGNV